MKEVILLWSSYGIVLAALFVVLAGHVQHLAHPRERSFLAALTSALLLTTVAASLLLPALDVALVSSTNIASLGVRKDGATDAKVDSIVLWLKLAYVLVYALTAILTIFLVPFSWAYYEEWDEDSTRASRIATALKYTLAIAFTLLVLLAIGFFVPTTSKLPNGMKDVNLDYLKALLASSKPVKSLLFVLGILLCVGTIALAYYTATGLSVLPLSFLKTRSIADLDTADSEPAVDLDYNRQQQRQIELRYADSRIKMSTKDRRELAALQRRERELLRAQRLRLEGRSRKLQRLYKPVLVFFGLIFLVCSLLFMVTLGISLISGLLSNSTCGARCRFLEHIPSTVLLNPLHLLFSKMPVYAIFIAHTLLILFLMCATITGIKALGIRFLWMSLFPIGIRHTVPQGLLSLAIVFVFTALGLQYTMAQEIVPAYVSYGTQTFCNGTLQACADDSKLVVACNDLTTEKGTGCTRSVISRVGASLVANFPGFGIVLFWAQFVVLGVFVFALVVSVFKKNFGHTADVDDVDDDEDVLATERTRLI